MENYFTDGVSFYSESTNKETGDYSAFGLKKDGMKEVSKQEFDSMLAQSEASGRAAIAKAQEEGKKLDAELDKKKQGAKEQLMKLGLSPDAVAVLLG
jgi:arsenate reductase-like glutaredoxin family protein